jgi:hypothetical protein
VSTARRLLCTAPRHTPQHWPRAFSSKTEPPAFGGEVAELYSLLFEQNWPAWHAIGNAVRLHASTQRPSILDLVRGRGFPSSVRGAVEDVIDEPPRGPLSALRRPSSHRRDASVNGRAYSCLSLGCVGDRRVARESPHATWPPPSPRQRCSARTSVRPPHNGRTS